MGKTPSFPFYPGDWTRDLDDYDLEIEGAWIRLVCRLWWSETRGEATKHIREWARILRKTEKKTIKIFQILFEKRIADGAILDNQTVKLISRRMKRDYEISQIRRAVGATGGNPALIKPLPNLDNQNPNQKGLPSSSFSSSSSKKEKTSKKMGFVLPAFISKETWAAYKEMRQRKKAPLTDRAAALTVKELEKLKSQGHDPEAVLNQSIMKSWTGVFPVSTGGNGNGAFTSTGGNGNNGRTYTNRQYGRNAEIPDATAAALAKLEEEYERSISAARSHTRRDAEPNDVPDFESSGS